MLDSVSHFYAIDVTIEVNFFFMFASLQSLFKRNLRHHKTCCLRFIYKFYILIYNLNSPC